VSLCASGREGLGVPLTGATRLGPPPHPLFHLTLIFFRHFATSRCDTGSLKDPRSFEKAAHKRRQNQRKIANQGMRQEVLGMRLARRSQLIIYAVSNHIPSPPPPPLEKDQVMTNVLATL
jgi:hypothetical protein